nr:MAG TPA: Hemolysin [Caudoviricetes sp.]
MLIELSNCVSRLTTLQEQMEKTVLTMNERISDIEQKPSNILTVIITAVITAGITTLFSLLVR